MHVGHVRPRHVDAREAGGHAVREQQGLHRAVGVVHPAVNQIPLNDVNGAPQRPRFQNGGAGRDGQGRSGSAHDSLSPQRQKRRPLLWQRAARKFLTRERVPIREIVSSTSCNALSGTLCVYATFMPTLFLDNLSVSTSFVKLGRSHFWAESADCPVRVAASSGFSLPHASHVFLTPGTKILASPRELG